MRVTSITLKEGGWILTLKDGRQDVLECGWPL